MAASISKQTESKGHPQKSTQTSALKKGKGKAKDNNPEPDPKSQTEPVVDFWEHDTPWNWTSLTDPCSNNIPPIFTRDGSYFFSLEGSSVKIHSTATGLIVSTLTTPSLRGRSGSNVLTSAVVNPQNPFQLITASQDGRLLIWDFVNGTLLQTVNVGQDIHMMCAHEALKGSVFVAAAIPGGKANDKNAVVLQVSLKHIESGQIAEKNAIGKIRFPSGLAISASGTWLVATASHKAYIARTSDLSTGFTKYVSPESLTCLAFHPLEDYFATGDDKGVVRLWYCLNEDLAVNVRDVEKRTQTRPLHWHAHAVSSVMFSKNGAYLLSGGEEAVLVIWQLHTGKKEFVPRVGAPISTVSVTRSMRTGEEEYLLSLVDATLTFISSTSLKISRSYSRLKFDPRESSTTKSHPIPLAVHPLSSTLVLPSSHPSSLQIYSPLSSTLLSELEISPSNRVSRREDKPISAARVEKVVISSCGLWMATVDCRVGDSGFRSEVYLKFWSWVKKDESWTLNTRIDRPHGSHKITDISFCPDFREPQPSFLVSIGEDYQIKVWQLLSMPETDTSIWISFATLTFRSEKPTSISWSHDSSIFGIAAGPHLALYDPFTKSLRQTLTTPNSPPIQSVHFIKGPQGYLLSSASKTLTMWDMIHGRVAWQTTLPFSIEKILSHRHEASFAVFHSMAAGDSRYKVSIFQASSSIPSSVHSLPFTLRNVELNSFQASTGFSFFAITHAWRVVVMGDSVPSSTEEGLSPKAINLSGQRQNRTLFQDIFGVTAFEEESHINQPSTSAPLSGKGVDHPLSDTPAFATPPFDTFFDPFVNAFLTTRELRDADKAEEEEEDVGIVDDVMDELEDTAVIQHSRFRLPNHGDLEAFAQLFRSTCSVAEATKRSVPKTNGKETKPKRTKLNGSSKHPVETSAALLKQSTEASSQQNYHPGHDLPKDSSVPIQSSKKRKKTSS